MLSIVDPNRQDDPTLFSSIRARYQSILEEVLEHNILNGAASSDFAGRYNSGSYLCRFRSCPRATHGFNSSDLRQEHESMHTSRFRCMDASCGLFGRTFKSRDAMNKHAIKYHGDDGLATIPSSLRKASTRVQQDRHRFLLKEPSSASRKRSFDAAEEVDVIIKCICGFEEDDGNTMYCDLCDTWQHTECYYIDKHGSVPGRDALESLLEHFCVDCRPRPLDAKGAIVRQMERKEHSLKYPKDALSSYWSVPEQGDLRLLVQRYGTNWGAIADNMKSKTLTMVWEPVFVLGYITD